MISIELLRRYPLFGRLGYEQLKTLTIIAEEIQLKNGQEVIEEEKPVDALSFPQEVSVALFHPVGSPRTMGEARKCQFVISILKRGSASRLSSSRMC
jgi:hypothetical protein